MTNESTTARLAQLRGKALKGAGLVVGLLLLMVVLNLISSWIWGKATIWNYYRSEWCVDQALIQMEVGDSAAALRSLNHAITLNPRNAQAYIHRGKLHWEARDDPSAVADLLSAFRYSRSDAMRAHACLKLGAVQGAAGNQQAALEAIDKAIAYDPALAQAYAARGMVHRVMGNLDAALTDLNQAIMLRSDFADAFAERALVYLQREDWSQALLNAEQAISLDASVADSHAVRGRVKMERQEYQEAAADLSAAIACDPTQATYFEWRAVVYRELGADSLVEADLREMHRLRGEH